MPLKLKRGKDFFKFINFIKESGVKMDIIFIEAHEAIILGRYTLSRRAHPLKENTLLKSILKEKEIDRKWIPNFIEEVGEDAILDCIRELKTKLIPSEFIQQIFDFEKKNDKKNIL